MLQPFDVFATEVEQDVSEEKIHAALVALPMETVLPSLFGWNSQHSSVVSKPSFHSLIPDFAVGQKVRSTQLHEWVLIELERPGMKLFTKAGNPTAQLTHAVNQVNSWRKWVSDNIAYARTILPDVNASFLGIVVIGRRSMLEHHDALSAYNESLLQARVRTYDWLLDKARELESSGAL